MDKTGHLSRENHLSGEKSPYLKQHASNPVDWFPWGEEAFDRARRQDKPVFLSIGYSACHWCHVMERESFQDREVADAMNRTFISVKVDREERPDIDALYMEVCQMLTGRGGWPLTIIMTPEKKPFFAGTYIPKQGRAGSAGMMELITEIGRLWKNERSSLEQASHEITELLNRDHEGGENNLTEKELIQRAVSHLKKSYDPVHGGTGRAPKFPMPHVLLFLLRYGHVHGDDDTVTMVRTTLKKMRRGGIFDQLGFGFHRYSTDAAWFVPHFEKMLYDQALIAMACIEAFQVSGDELFSRTAHEIFEYVLRDLTSPQGAFYAAEDADSEGEEGAFYLWSHDEISALTGGSFGLARDLFGIKKDGNYRDESTGRKTSLNILTMPDDRTTPRDRPESGREFQKIRKLLFDHRNKRTRPGRDEKILADWNGLMIAALAMGGRALHEPAYVTAAEKALDFIMAAMAEKDFRIMHRYCQGESAITGMLDDYAFLGWGCIELYHATFKQQYLDMASAFHDNIIRFFINPEKGILSLSPLDGEKHIAPPSILHDGALPSGNATALYNLLRLDRLTGNHVYGDEAEKLLDATMRQARNNPVGHTMLLLSLLLRHEEPRDITLAGNPDDPLAVTLLREINSSYLPHAVLFNEPAANPHLVICTGNTCGLPLRTPEEVRQRLSK